MKPLMMAGLVWLLACCGGGEEEEPLPSTSTIGLEAPAEESTTTTVAPNTSTLPPPPLVEDLLFVPESFREKLVELVEETQNLRGLSFSQSLSIEAITSQEMTRRLRAQVEDDPDLVQLNQTLFKLLGLVDYDTDWLGLLAEFYGRPTPGFYDVSGKKLWLLSTLEAPTPLEEVTLVGEIAKALVDQNLGIWERRSRLSRSGQGDSLTVLAAMAEADSTLIELLFADGRTAEYKGQVAEQTWALSATATQLPSFMQASLRLSSGPALDYLQKLYQQGGWDAVNDGHRRPPQSTEQILSLALEQPEPVLLPRPGVSPPQGYREEMDSVWGQWGWNTLFSAVLDSSRATSAAWGWGGDRYLVFGNGQEVALVLDYVGDTVSDTQEMRMALEEYIPIAMQVGAARSEDHGLEYYDADYAWLSGGEGGEMVTFIAATDVELGRQLRAYRFG